MKVTIAKLFEVFQLGPDGKKLEPLVAFLNGAIDQIVKALQGRLTLRDNAFTEIRSLTFTKATDPNTAWTQEFTPAQRTVEGVVILQSEASDGNTVASWSYAFTSKGTIVLSVYPRLMASTSPLTVKLAVLFQ